MGSPPFVNSQVILAAAGKLAFAFRKCLLQKLQLEEEGRVHCVSLYLCTTLTIESAAPTGPSEFVNSYAVADYAKNAINHAD